MVVTVVGLGFVGLTTALGFAELGHKVYGLESNPERLAAIRAGRLPFLEPGLDKALARHLGRSFHPVASPAEALRASQIIYFCVGTPYGQDGQADLRFLFEALRQCLAHSDDGRFRVLVIKSTVPPGSTSKRVAPFVASLGFEAGRDLGLACNPEFLREGHCWDDFIQADRIVLGVSDARSAQALRELYQPLSCPVFCVSPDTAEFVKYLSNTLLATLISYSNEMSLAADALGDIETAEAFRILHLDRRWGGCEMTSYVWPGCGYGGYCLPKDTNALKAAAEKSGFETSILKNVIAVNEGMSQAMAARITKAAGHDQKACLGLLGLSFKPGSDDVRDAPSARIMRELNNLGYDNIVAFDPAVQEREFKSHYGDLVFSCASDLPELLRRADIVALLTAWPEFLNLRELTAKPVVDCRYALKSVTARL